MAPSPAPMGAGEVEARRVEYLIGATAARAPCGRQPGLPLEGHDYPTAFFIASVRSVFVGPGPGSRSLLVGEVGPAQGESARPGEPSLEEIQAIMAEAGRRERSYPI